MTDGGDGEQTKPRRRVECTGKNIAVAANWRKRGRRGRRVGEHGNDCDGRVDGLDDYIEWDWGLTGWLDWRVVVGDSIRVFLF